MRGEGHEMRDRLLLLQRLGQQELVAGELGHRLLEHVGFELKEALLLRRQDRGALRFG